MGDGFLQGIYAERTIKCNGQAPGKNHPRGPTHDRTDREESVAWRTFGRRTMIRSHALVFCCFLCFLVCACGGSGGTNPSLADLPSDGGGGEPAGPEAEEWSTAIFTEPVIARDNPLFTFQIVSSPALAADGTIYVGSTDNRLYALSKNGTIKWEYETGDQVIASPAIGSDGTVYVGSADRQLYAINPDGTLRWVYPTKVILSSSPALASDGTIYVAGTNLDGTFICSAPPNAVQLSTFYAVNPNGTLKWNLILSGNVNSSPVIANDGTIYIGSAGDARPKQNEDNPDPDQPPQISFDRINPCDPTSEFPPSDANPFYPVNGHVYAINPDGTIKWDFKALGNVDSSAAIGTDGTIYIGSDYPTYAYKGADKTDLMEIGSLTTGYLYAINPDGTLRWYTDLFGNVKSSPAIGSDGTIYVGSDKEDVFALDTDGEIIWVFPTLGPVRSSPALASDGTIYVGSNDSTLYALNPDGTVQSRFAANAAISSSPSITADGTVYFATGVPLRETQDFPYVEGPPALYAISGTGGLADTPWPKFRLDPPNTGRQ
jgi:outer membrane protein assembly factor BamB